MEVFDVIAALATLGALIAAISQLHVGNRDRRSAEQAHRVERSMRLHEDVVAGTPTAIAFHELSVYLRRQGSQNGSVTWHLPSDADLVGDGVFAPIDDERERAFANLYTVLWFFERCEVAIDSQAADAAAVYGTLGFHCWWWGQVLRDLHAPKATQALQRLSRRAQDVAAERRELDDWHSRCATDFATGPAIELA